MTFRLLCSTPDSDNAISLGDIWYLQTENKKISLSRANCQLHGIGSKTLKITAPWHRDTVKKECPFPLGPCRSLHITITSTFYICGICNSTENWGCKLCRPLGPTLPASHEVLNCWLCLCFQNLRHLIIIQFYLHVLMYTDQYSILTQNIINMTLC